MTVLSKDQNLQVYEAAEVAAHYAALDYLSACERLLFETYIPTGSAVLDLGVGGGRTTPYLASRASRYVGIDYSPAMVKACRAKFPQLEFMVADASDLSAFPSASFDAVVFAFNGIDYVLPEGSRRQCFEHVSRILKQGGLLIFSSHNARSFVIRAGWNRERLAEIARRISGNAELFMGPLMVAMTLMRSLLALGQSIWRTLGRAWRRIPSRMFWRGEGYLLDPVHGGLHTYHSTPSRIIAELSRMRLRPLRVLGDDYPRRSHPYATDWYYYVFAKSCESEPKRATSPVQRNSER